MQTALPSEPEPYVPEHANPPGVHYVIKPDGLPLRSAVTAPGNWGGNMAALAVPRVTPIPYSRVFAF